MNIVDPTYSIPTPPHSDPDSPSSDTFNELESSQMIDELITANEVQVSSSRDQYDRNTCISMRRIDINI